ncbi:TMV resistance protein N-like [Solanum stenotomum]|uniref:TMV resistance protein N-like n=1 Tax=Solanum stenotomum TaxID=172797 RepID=UPI0020D1DABC|nr:TMV resistance protein N-like [Solanum stenotomum]
MHDLIEDMGKNIVKMQKDSSRILNVEDFEDMMMNNMGTRKIESIWLTYSEKLCFSKEAMKNMQKLRILCIWRDPWNFPSDSEDGSMEYLPNNLRWFVWHQYPWKLLPENFNPRRLVHLDLRWNSLHHLWNETKQFLSLRRIDLRDSNSLKRTPDFKGMPNLEYLNLQNCTSLEEVHHSLKYCRNLMQLNLSFCTKLERFPYVNAESLESLNLRSCSSLEKFPEIHGRMKQGTAIKIMTSHTRITELPLSFLDLQPHLTELHLDGMTNLVSLPSSICKLKGLVKLDVSYCSKLKSLPEEIGDLENLEKLDSSYTLISRPPSSIVRLNKLKLLNFRKRKAEDRVNFVLTQLPEDIGSLSSLKYLYLNGNNFEHLPHSISKLGALQSLNLSDCKRLTQLPEFPQKLDTIDADWSNDSFCNSLFQNISSLQHAICSSDSLSLRVFGSWVEDIPSWFKYQGMCPSVSVDLPENWYDKFLGFAVCYYDKYYIDCIRAHLIPSCDDGMSSMTQQFALSNKSELDDDDVCNINFLLVPLCGLWDASNANEITPNGYGRIKLDFIGHVDDFGETDDDFGETDDDFGETDDAFGEKMKFGVRLLSK